MKTKSLLAVAAIAISASASSLASQPLSIVGPSDLGTLTFGDTYLFGRTIPTANTGINDFYSFALSGSGGSITGSLTSIDNSITFFPGGPVFQLLAIDDLAGTIAAYSNSGSGTAFQFNNLPNGSFALNIVGTTTGYIGGSYYGDLTAVASVPEPESYAMFLAGLGVMGAIAIRRNKAKDKA